MKYKYPLAVSSWGTEEIDAINRVVASNQFTMGERVLEFEQKFARFMGSQHCVMANSGSSANLLMIASLFYTGNEKRRLHRGDEVIVPALSWATTYYPLYQYGLKMKMVDIDVETLNYDVDQLSQAVSSQTRMILAVNILGNPNQFDEIKKIIDDKAENCVLVEDNCESMGALFSEKMAGTFGIMGSYSSFFSHHMSTMEGGMVVTDDEELYHILLSLRAHGWTRNLPKKNWVTGEKSENQFDEWFRFVLPGYNLRPIEMEGAIGTEQLKKLPEFLKMRRQNAARFTELLEGHPDIQIQKEIGKSSWFGFSLLLRPESKLVRSDVIGFFEGSGFECRPIVAGNFARNEVMKYFDVEIPAPLRGAEYVHERGFFIGNHHFPMTEAFDALEGLRLL